MTVKQLFEKHGATIKTNKTICHSDQGIHYTSIDFQKLLKDKGLRQSMSRRGNCWDNAPQESFFGHMKDEIDISRCNTFNDLKAVIDDYIDYYNNERYQWDLAKLSPSEYYQYWLSDIYPIDIKKWYYSKIVSSYWKRIISWYWFLSSKSSSSRSILSWDSKRVCISIIW